MLKRDRTNEEKQFDRNLKGAIMNFGAQSSSEAATPNPFPYVLFWDRLGRKGQRCRVIKSGMRVAMLEFDDGFRHTIDKRAIRRI